MRKYGALSSMLLVVHNFMPTSETVVAFGQLSVKWSLLLSW
jgi:hypothetical protein